MLGNFDASVLKQLVVQLLVFSLTDLQFELVCANQAGASFLQSVYFGGLLFGSIVFGSIADW